MSIPEAESRSRMLEFIAQNSPGSIIGYSAYNPASAASYTTAGTSMTYVVDGSSNKKSVTFTAPPTGKVEISVSVWVEQNATISATSYLAMALSTDGITWSTYNNTYKRAFLGTEHVQVPSQAHTTMRWAIDSLSPGASTTFYLGASEVNSPSAFVLKWGGGGEWPGLIMKATTLPREINT